MAGAFLQQWPTARLQLIGLQLNFNYLVRFSTIIFYAYFVLIFFVNIIVLVFIFVVVKLQIIIVLVNK